MIASNPPQVEQSHKGLPSAECLVRLQGVWRHCKAILVTRVMFLDSIGDRIVVRDGWIGPRGSEVVREFAIPGGRTNGSGNFEHSPATNSFFPGMHKAEYIVVDVFGPLLKFCVLPC